MSITINGTTGIAGVDGSASTPAVQGTDTNTGEFFPAADTIAWATGGSERMRVTSTGSVGIGTSSPARQLTVYETDTPIIALQNSTTGTTVNDGTIIYVSGSDASIKNKEAAGGILFHTGGDTERMRILSGAPILCLSGGSTSATGTGIAFPATQSASSDANTLDDYEEGTWTPTFRGAGTAGTYTLSGTIATYTKVGRMVCISAYFTFSAASGGTAYAVIEGMPFNIGSVSLGIPYFASVDLSATTKYVTVQRISAATNTRLYFSEVVDNGSSIDLAIAAFTTSSTVQFSLVYEAA